MSAREGSLVGAALCWVLAATAMLRLSRRPLPEQQRWIERVGGFLPHLSGFTVEQAAWAITAATRRVPGSRCLAWSLALRGLLTQMHVPSELRIGVASAEGGRMTAHAWVHCQEKAWSWGGDVRAYQILRPQAGLR